MSAGSARQSASPPRTLVYVLGQVPQLSETFIWQEVAAQLRAGLAVVPISIARRPELTFEDMEARFVMQRTSYLPASPAALFLVCLRVLLRHPVAAWRLASLNRALPILPDHSRLRRLARALTVLRTAARLHSAHLHGHWTIPSDVAMLVARALNTSYSWSAHAHDIYDEAPLILGEGDGKGLSAKLEGARFVLSCTASGRTRLAELAGGVAFERVIVHHHGVDTERFRPDPQRVPGNPPLLVSVGRLVAYKGFDRLLEILRHLADDGHTFHCFIVGDGSRAPALKERAVALGLGGQVTFAGSQAPEAVCKLLKRADLFLLTADPNAGQRGLPNVLVEAMSAGLPTLTTRLPAVTELIEDGANGLLLPPDPREAARIVGRTLRDPELRRRLGASARERILADFDLRRQTAALVHRFAGVLGEVE